jgi:hypothetical protein
LPLTISNKQRRVQKRDANVMCRVRSRIVHEASSIECSNGVKGSETDRRSLRLADARKREVLLFQYHARYRLYTPKEKDSRERETKKRSFQC